MSRRTRVIRYTTITDVDKVAEDAKKRIVKAKVSKSNKYVEFDSVGGVARAYLVNS